MILSSLVDLYEVLAQKGEIPKNGWSKVKLSFALSLNLQGELIGIIDLRKEVERGKKKVIVPGERSMPSPVKRSSGVAANFLWDNSSYILGADEKGSPDKAEKKFKAFAEKFREVTNGKQDEMILAISRFLENWEPKKTPDHPLIQEYWKEISTGANLTFRVDGKFADENPDIIRAWDEYLNQSGSEEKGFCLATGRYDSVARLHPSVKGVQGAQSSGAALVSFNAPSYCSYGKEQGANSPVGEYAAFAYTSALNYLLSGYNNKVLLGDTTIVYWAKKAEAAYQDLFGSLFGMSSDHMDQTQLNSIMNKIADGQTVIWDDVEIYPKDEFYILGLSPNAARLSVRFFLRTTFGGMAQNLSRHYENIRVSHGPKNKDYLSLWNLLSETVNQKSKDKTPSPQLAGNLARAVLEGGFYPETLYTGVQLRIRAERIVNYGRAAVIKAYLTRNGRDINKEVLTVSLNEDSNYEPYVLGRLFSILEGLQNAANPGINATIRDKYFNSACAMPSVIFPILLKLSNSHLRKLYAPSRIYYDKLIQGVMSKLGTSFPQRLNLQEQGVFQLGYYHQTEKRFEKKNKDVTETSEEEI